MHLPDRETLALIGVVLLAGLLVVGALRLATTRQERHRRKAERDRRRGRHDTLSTADAAEVLAMGQLVHSIRTGEFPMVEAVIAPEPIGPQPPTVDDRYAVFAADPLGAPLPGKPAKDNVLYRDLLAEHGPAMSPELLDRLEGPTGYWQASDFKAVSHG